MVWRFGGRTCSVRSSKAGHSSFVWPVDESMSCISSGNEDVAADGASFFVQLIRGRLEPKKATQLTKSKKRSIIEKGRLENRTKSKKDSKQLFSVL